VTRALDVADLRDDDDLVAGKFTGVDQLLQGAADETLAGAVKVVRGSIDEVDARA